jgi:23S rRNA pseudouridine2605 synthase
VLKVAGKMSDDDLDRWRRGVDLEDGKTLPAEVDLLRHEGDKTWIELTIREGRNQQIRRMGEATRFPVMRLARTSFAGVTSEGLAPGRWRYLTRQELVDLKKTYGVPKRIPHDLPEGGGDGGGASRRSEARRGGDSSAPSREPTRERTTGARYGFGAPARRAPDTQEDYGGGVRRGRADMPMRTTGANTYDRKNRSR